MRDNWEKEEFDVISYKLSDLGHSLESISFLNKEKGSSFLSEEEEFYSSLSRFDIASRSDPENVKQFYANQVIFWKKGEIDSISNIFEIINWKMRNLTIKFPPDILLLVTTGKEEGYALYCRNNAIVLSREKILFDRYTLERLLTHELFHIFSQNHPKLRAMFYKMLGFQECDKIQYPADIKGFIITNPDTYRFPCYIEIDRLNYIPILYSKTKFGSPVEHYYERPSWKGDYHRNERTFFDYAEFGLLRVDLTNGKLNPIIKNGKSFIIGENNKNLFKKYLDKIGRNTNYYIHPEEIMAENFLLMVNNEENYVENPNLLSHMRKILSN